MIVRNTPTASGLLHSVIDMETPLNLRGIAHAVAEECGDKGAVVISFGEGGAVRIGVENLKPEELREALCTAIHYSYVFEEKQQEP